MASNYGGYMGRILLVDLTKETSMEYPWTDAQRKETLGGKNNPVLFRKRFLLFGEML